MFCVCRAAPCRTHRIGRPISMTMRIAIGFVIQIIALLSAGIIELLRYKMVRDSGLVAAFIAAGPDADPLDPKFTEPMRWVGWAWRPQ